MCVCFRYAASSFLPARLHNIKLLDLEPETRYDFRLITSNNGLDSAASDISSVNTNAPGETTGNVEFDLFSGGGNWLQRAKIPLTIAID